MLIIEQCIYSDLNPETQTLGTPPLIVNKDSVFQSINNLITTHIGERLNLVTYGVRLPDYLFEQIDSRTSEELRFALINAVKTWEPRVEVNKALTTVTPYPDDNAYRLHLVFDLVGFNQSSIIIAGLYKKQFDKDI